VTRDPLESRVEGGLTVVFSGISAKLAFTSYKFNTVRLPGWLNALFFQC